MRPSLTPLPDNLLDKINTGECATVEFKAAQGDHLPSSLFETICAMLNRQGGDLFLGVDDSGDILGLRPDQIDRFKQDFANLCNNPTKISPVIRLELKTYSVDDKIILHTYIFKSSGVHHTVGRIFDRNEDGDFDITDSSVQISQLYIEKSNTYIENRIFPHADMSDLRPDLFTRIRRMAAVRNPEHPWLHMSDKEVLCSASLYGKDMTTGQEGINLAGILLLGTDEAIASAIPYYRTDALLRVKDTERYDDRDDIRTNLIDACDRLTRFIAKHTDDRFYLEGQQRVDVRSVIARELCANTLIHREYSNPLPARLTISKDAIIAENASRPHTFGYIDLNSYTPYPKNPKIADFFKEIGYADELGSGIRKIARYSKIYSGQDPQFEEGNTFTALVPLTANGVKHKVLDHKAMQRSIYIFLRNNNGATRRSIFNHLSHIYESQDQQKLNNSLHYNLNTMKNRGIIKNTGSRKFPFWVIDDNQ